MPYRRTNRYSAERLRQCLRWQDDRDSRIGTHSAECYKFGHRHYECALAEIERLRACVRHESDCAEAFKAEADALRGAWAMAAETTDS